jgi:D-glycero-D-manno-heptose 1,7-bisphosphate phosphatase
MREPFLVLLDRDGTINIDRQYLGDPAGLEFLPGALEGLTILRDGGAVFAIVTNQSGIGRALFDREQADAVNDHLVNMLSAHGIEIAHVALCPHTPDGGCACRKPAPGMALEAAEATGLPLEQAWMIGDKTSDTGLADAVGARGILITDDPLASPAEHFTAGDLVEAAGIILREG